MTNQIELGTTRLGIRLQHWKRALADAATGPLVIAADVCDVADHWEGYRADADGVDATTWLKTNTGWNLAWFRRRNTAVLRLGEAVRRWMHHEVAVWLLPIPDESVREVVASLRVATHRNNENPISLAVAKPIVNELLHRVPSTEPRACPRCKVLVALLEKHGIPVPADCGCD